MIYATEKRQATKLIGCRCRIQTGLFMEPTLWLGDTGFYMQNPENWTFVLFDPEGKELASGDFYDVCRAARKALQERAGGAPGT